MKTCNNVKCTIKGVLASDESKFCTKCGQKTIAAKSKGICGHENFTDDTYCKTCGVYLYHDPRQDDEEADDAADYHAEIKAENDRETIAGI